MEHLHKKGTITASFSDIPSTSPAIYGLKSIYGVGGHLNLTCESGPSSPPTSLSWFMNGAKIPHEEPLVTDMLPIYPLPDQRAISRSFLSFPLTASSSPLPHPLIVECEAAVGDIYKKYAKVRVRISGEKISADHETDWRGWVQRFSGAETGMRRCYIGWGLGILIYMLLWNY